LPAGLTSDEAKAGTSTLVLKKKIQSFIDEDKEKAAIAIFKFRSTFLNSRALASITPGRERFSWNLSL